MQPDFKEPENNSERPDDKTLIKRIPHGQCAVDVLYECLLYISVVPAHQTMLYYP